MAHIELKFERTFDALMAARVRAAVVKASVRSVNTTIKSARTMVQRFIAEKTELKRKDFIKRLYIQGASKDYPDASLRFFGRGIPLFQFSARKKVVKTAKGRRIGVTALVKGTRQFVPGAFIAEMKSGKTGVFSRVGDDRLPIRQLFSNELSDLFQRESGFLPQLKAHAEDTLRRNFDRDLEFYLAKS